MMAPKELLINILRNEMTTCQTANYKIWLEEEKNQGKPGLLSKVEIKSIPIGSLILKADMATMSIFKIPNKKNKEPDIAKKYRRQCDYIIITEYNNKKYILYLEMKSTTQSNEYIQQLWCSRSLMEYLNFAIKNLDMKNITSTFDDYEHRYAKLACIPLDKDTTNPNDKFKTKNFKNNKPGKSCVYFCSNGCSIILKNLLQ